MKLKQKMLEHKCNHKDNDKTLNICFKCFKLVEAEFGECSHIQSRNLRKLEPSGYSFLLVDNYKRELVDEISYFQESAEDPKPVSHFMKMLREEMVPFLTDKIVPNTAMQITQLEEQLFKQASSCYCCHRKFRDIPGNDAKCRDHCHVTVMIYCLCVTVVFNLLSFNFRVCIAGLPVKCAIRS